MDLNSPQYLLARFLYATNYRGVGPYDIGIIALWGAVALIVIAGFITLDNLYIKKPAFVAPQQIHTPANDTQDMFFFTKEHAMFQVAALILVIVFGYFAETQNQRDIDRRDQINYQRRVHMEVMSKWEKQKRCSI